MTNEFTAFAMDLMTRFIPNKYIKCDDKDPLWMAPEINAAIKHNHHVYNRRVGGPEVSKVAAMMSTGMLSFSQSGVQKNHKSLYQSFVPQKFASVHVCANRYNRKNKFSVRSIFQFEVSKSCWTVWLNHCVQRAR